MDGEWINWDMIICLVLLIMNVFVFVISGKLFMKIFCFLILLVFLIIRCIFIWRGVV